MTALAPFIPTSDDLRPFAAELFLVLGIAANLLVPFVARRPNFICAGVTLVALAAAVISLLSMGAGGGGGSHLRGLLLFDSTAYFWKLILLLFVCGVVVLWMDHSGRKLRQGDAPEFFVLLLGATLGMCLMASTTNLLMIFMAIAMASLPSYLLAGFAKQSKRGSEASLKYVLFGAVTGAILIYGISFLYGLHGTLQLTELAASVPSAALSVALIGLLIGVGFKISAVPLHSWCPDVFEGSTIEVTTFLSVASKGAALVLLLRIVQASGATHLGWVVGLIGAITATVGNLGAFAQSNVKRLLAYSSIAQAGYMMCVISAVGGKGGEGGQSAQALLIYLCIYAVMNLGAFAVSAVVIGQSKGMEGGSFAGRVDVLLFDQPDRPAAFCGVWGEGECALGAGPAGRGGQGAGGCGGVEHGAERVLLFPDHPDHVFAAIEVAEGGEVVDGEPDRFGIGPRLRGRVGADVLSVRAIVCGDVANKPSGKCAGDGSDASSGSLSRHPGRGLEFLNFGPARLIAV